VKLVAKAGGEDELGFWAKTTVSADMMVMMLAHLDVKYGGVEGYLRTAGMSAAEISKLKTRLFY
jgi:hypothetical protein